MALSLFLLTVKRIVGTIYPELALRYDTVSPYHWVKNSIICVCNTFRHYCFLFSI